MRLDSLFSPGTWRPNQSKEGRSKEVRGRDNSFDSVPGWKQPCHQASTKGFGGTECRNCEGVPWSGKKGTPLTKELEGMTQSNVIDQFYRRRQP